MVTVRSMWAVHTGQTDWVCHIGILTLCVEAVAWSCIIVTWWSGSGGIQAWSLTTKWFPSVLWHCWFGHLACKNRPRNDLLCVEWDVKPYTLTVFAISYGWDVISRNLSKSAFLEGICHFERKFQTEGSVTCQSLLASEKHSDCPLLWYQNILSALFDFVTKHACDGRTDRRTELRQLIPH